jgi:RimJ/RimL family protein N-acetyltransferase
MAPHDGLAWTHAQGQLLVVRPTPAQITGHAPQLAAFFNEDYNRRMMGNTVALTPAEVVEHYTDLLAEGGCPFFLFLDDHLVGDADFRQVRDGYAEFTIAIGPRSAQGKGLGHAFALLTHAFAFARLPLDTIVVAILPHNLPSLRLFQGLGYRPDDRPAARAYAEADSEIILSLHREDFTRQHAETLAQLPRLGA